MKRTSEKQRLLAGLISFVGLAAYVSYLYLLQPLGSEVAHLSQQVHDVAAQVRQLEQLIEQGHAIRREYGQLQAEVAQLRDRLPSEDELPSVIERLSGLASQTGVRILSISPQHSDQPPSAREASAPSAAAPYQAIAIEIDALSGFHQFGMFLSQVESGDQPVEVKQLRITQSTRELRRHTIRLLLLTYVTVGVGG